MTPMEKLKPQFDTFNTLIGPTFKQVNLNKAPFRSNISTFCGEKTENINKGVQSDFIRLFQIAFNDHKFALAFSFHYLDEPNNPSISFSCSDSYLDIKRYSKTTVMNVSELQSKMNSINSTLKSSENLSINEKLVIIQMELLGFDFINRPPENQFSNKKSKKNNL